MTHHAVVTGGAGFLGSHLCDTLLEHGYRVTCIDNFITGSPDNISHLKNHPQLGLKDFYELQLARQDHPKDQPMGALEAAWTVNCTSRAHENGTYDKGINLAENIFLGTE